MTVVLDHMTKCLKNVTLVLDNMTDYLEYMTIGLDDITKCLEYVTIYIIYYVISLYIKYFGLPAIAGHTR